mgnify:CR=1 FL=1
MSIETKQLDNIKYLQNKKHQFDKEGYPFKNRFVLLITSYCIDNPKCSDFRPCLDCLQMCNVGILEDGKISAICGYDFINPAHIDKNVYKIRTIE